MPLGHNLNTSYQNKIKSFCFVICNFDTATPLLNLINRWNAVHVIIHWYCKVQWGDSNRASVKTWNLQSQFHQYMTNYARYFECQGHTVTYPFYWSIKPKQNAVLKKSTGWKEWSIWGWCLVEKNNNKKNNMQTKFIHLKILKFSVMLCNYFREFFFLFQICSRPPSHNHLLQLSSQNLMLTNQWHRSWLHYKLRQTTQLWQLNSQANPWTLGNGPNLQSFHDPKRMTSPELLLTTSLMTCAYTRP